jgi:hypothetical protein
MNIVEFMADNVILHDEEGWEEDDTVYDKGDILGQIFDPGYEGYEQYLDPNCPIFDPTIIKYKEADGKHTFKELKFHKEQFGEEHHRVVLKHGTKEQLAKEVAVPYLGQLICEEQPDGTRKFKIGNGMIKYRQLAYLYDLEDFPSIFIE